MKTWTALTLSAALIWTCVGACGGTSSELGDNGGNSGGLSGSHSIGEAGVSDAGRAGDDAPALGGAGEGGEAGDVGLAGASGAASGASEGGGAGTAGSAAGTAGSTAGTAGSAAGSTAKGSTGALLLDGVDDYVAIPAAAGAANEAAFSSELWFKSGAPTGMLLEVYSTDRRGADRSLYLLDGRLCFYVYTPSYSELCTTAASFDDETWHHVAGTLGASGQLLYVDGRMEARSLSVTASAFDYDSAFRAGYGYIGPNGPLTYYAGELDEVRIWSTQRSPAQIAANLGRSIDPASPGLQGYWRLDESDQVKIAIDAAADGHNGALMGFSQTASPWVSPGAF